MKKMILSFVAIIGVINLVSAQAYEGTAQYDKKKRNAVIIEYPYTAEAVQNAIDQKMQKLGYRGKEEKGLFNGDKGFTVYSKAYLPEISDDALDYIIKVERKSKREDDKSILYLITMKGDADQSTLLKADGIEKAKSFLNDFTPNIEVANLELKIKAQEDEVAKSEKKLKKLQDDQSDLEGKVKKLQDNLKDNAKDQETTTKEIETLKLALESLRGQRKAM
ncbi:MAG: hypothetical protein QM764_15320 [Chitinophagaceae bacterium]